MVVCGAAVSGASGTGVDVGDGSGAGAGDDSGAPIVAGVAMAAGAGEDPDVPGVATGSGPPRGARTTRTVPPLRQLLDSDRSSTALPASAQIRRTYEPGFSGRSERPLTRITFDLRAFSAPTATRPRVIDRPRASVVTTARVALAVKTPLLRTVNEPTTVDPETSRAAFGTDKSARGVAACAGPPGTPPIRATRSRSPDADTRTRTGTHHPLDREPGQLT